MVPVLALGMIEGLLLALIWGIWVVLNLWIWQKSKAKGNLLMLVGASILTLVGLMMFFEFGLSSVYLLMWVGPFVLTAGFYLSVKPMVAAQIAALQAKAKALGHKDGGAGTPPPAAK